MAAAFDNVAPEYDGQFTDTAVGRLQREQVRDVLGKYLSRNPSASVLELNCGTGADALWMSQLAARVSATDLSAGMVEVARRNAGQNSENLDFQVADLREVVQDHSRKYDIVFSNFGGLNCIGPKDMADFARNLEGILVEGGVFIAVVMPQACLWESLYFAAKGRPKAALRRWKGGPVLAPLGNGHFQPTWYYSPKAFQSFFSAGWEVEKLEAVGFFVPPSYLDPFFQNKPRLLANLGEMDQKSRELGHRAAWADHFLIALSRKGH